MLAQPSTLQESQNKETGTIQISESDVTFLKLVVPLWNPEVFTWLLQVNWILSLQSFHVGLGIFKRFEEQLIA